MLAPLRRGRGFFIALIFLSASALNLGAAAVAVTVDGVSEDEVLAQVEANNADFDNIYLKIENALQVDEADGRSITVTPMTMEYWSYFDDDGDRKVKLFNHGPYPFMFLVNLADMKTQMLTMGGGIQTLEMPEAMRKAAEDMLAGVPGMAAVEDLAEYETQRLASADSADPAVSLPLVIAPGQADSAGVAEEAPAEAGQAPQRSWSRRALAREKPGLFDRSKRGRRFRGRLKPWQGKRLRSLKYIPKPGNADLKRAQKNGDTYAWMEKDVDMASGLVVAKRRYDAQGRLRRHDKVKRARLREDGVTVPVETESMDLDLKGRRTRIRTQFHANRVNQQLSKQDKGLIIPEEMKVKK